jgi:DNA (cytosine-5)-methyltransferase 1
MIPVVDIFAGPGGLGEGFSSFLRADGEEVFRIAISIEKDVHAHETLRLRAFWRWFPRDELPDVYWAYLRGAANWANVKQACPAAAAAAEDDALRLTLSPDAKTVARVRRLICERVPTNDPWILVGGPPCQAYSLIGRARNRGNVDYDPDTDHRQTLYIEYLQILADHAPTVFVMENVKGLLSAEHKNGRIFDRIREDLVHPAVAIAREGRKARIRDARYSLHSLVVPPRGGELSPADFIVRAENYGVPQKRHRVIIVGVLEGAGVQVGRLQPSSLATVKQHIGHLPRLRSGLSSNGDSLESWRSTLASFSGRRWLLHQPKDLRSSIRIAIAAAQNSDFPRGADFLPQREARPILNHESRGHMVKDLARYLFASAYGQQFGKSPTLSDFPRDILPDHANVRRGLDERLFHDRFRVQLANDASSTITSHISKDGHYFIHFDPVQCRSLTVREAATLQTFPPDYFFCGPRTSQYVQAGNAVPPELARRIAAIVAKALGRG